MKFIKDLLFFEIQTTGPDTDRDQILQLSAVLCDKDNLLEKSFFNAYVRVSYLESTMEQHARILQVDAEVFKKSQRITDVIRKFKDRFGDDVLLVTHSVSNVLFLKNAFKKSAVPFEYPSHMIDLWTLGYVYTLNYGLKKMPTFNTFLDFFKLKQEHPLDASEKVKLQAEIFRKIISEA